MSEAFVDVTYRGLEVGRRLKLTQVGPSTAYLEHGTPMPVGAQVELAVAEGLVIPAVVLRVHEQVAGAEQAPGMRVRAAGLEGAAAGWWQERVSCADPTIPEEQATPMPRTVPVAVPVPAATIAAAPGVTTAAPEAKTMMMTAVAPPPDAEEAPAMEMEADEPPDDADEDEAPKTIMMEAVAPPPEDEPSPTASRNGRNPSSTTVMSAVEIQEALGDAADCGGGNGNGEPAGDDSSARGKRRRRRRR
ncbi:MAG TPA: hypothetical protein VMZ28_09795 [Kofleriaceae bacterium]|nr:hypothetical protein [Kofleriaceae bacterium]